MTIFSHFHWRSEELGAVFSFWYCVSQLWDKKPVFQQSQFCLCDNPDLSPAEQGCGSLSVPRVQRSQRVPGVTMAQQPGTAAAAGMTCSSLAAFKLLRVLEGADKRPLLCVELLCVQCHGRCSS